MKYCENRVQDIRIAYVGGGSRGWAWGLMSDLANAADISGTVALYDIDAQAAANNAIIGNRYSSAPGARSQWRYLTCETLEEALAGADFVVISILPGTFREMASDVHTPEKYGIFQSVGDTTGPGGILRALRAVPMFERIADAIRQCCPGAWVINYTNPMTICVRTLYKAFPGIRAFGCCHEVFGTQKLLAEAVADHYGTEKPPHRDIRVNVLGVNHFTWLTSAGYQNEDLFPVYAEMAEKYADSGYQKGADKSWMNRFFDCTHKVKFDLFRRYGSIAAAGDRHLAEFCPRSWYLQSPEQVREWGFGLTPVEWRVQDLKKRLAKSASLLSGARAVELKPTGEDGVAQIRALLGLGTLVTNVNLPNRGQIPNLPADAVVETNAVFAEGQVTPCMAGDLPTGVWGLVAPIADEQEAVAAAARDRNLTAAFAAFARDPLVTLDLPTARRLFEEMVENTREYLGEYLK